MSGWDAAFDDLDDDPEPGPEPEPERRHHCHARGCDAPCPPAHLMCRRHWAMVPKALKEAVWEHYQPGQEQGRAPVTSKWLGAAEAAIQAVAAKQTRKPKAPEPKPMGPSEVLFDDEILDPPPSYEETGYAAPPERPPSSDDYKNRWMAVASRRHEAERKRLYVEALSLVLFKLAERRAQLMPEERANRAENAWSAAMILELGMVRDDERFEAELRRLGVKPELFLED